MKLFPTNDFQGSGTIHKKRSQCVQNVILYPQTTELLRKSATAFAAVEAIMENRGAEYGAVWSRPAVR